MESSNEMESSNKMESPNAMELVSPISSNVSEMGISTPVDKKNGVVFYELRYLLEKLDRDNNKDRKSPFSRNEQLSIIKF